MDNDRLVLGIGRLEQALSRVERALAGGESRPAPLFDDGLAERHEKLRAHMESAIIRIDSLIRRMEP